MTFSDKLDLLMSITKATNSDLARKISLNASFVSRLRRGERLPSKHEKYIKSMSDYFADNCSSDYQRIALCDALVIQSSEFPEDTLRRSGLIHEWLLENKANEAESIEILLSHLAALGSRSTKIPNIDPAGLPNDIDAETTVFYGIEGKQNAVVAFLTMALQNKTPRTLQLYSSEDMEWLTDNTEFAATWGMLLIQTIKQGNKIRIIHNVMRDPEEMLTSIREWMPVYMSGGIEPYYYPKKRQESFGRTLLIAPELAAVTSTSIGKGIRKAPTFLFKEKRTIAALSEEFNDLIIQSYPLMRIFNANNMGEFRQAFTEFDDLEADSIAFSGSLSCATMPDDVFQSIYLRTENSQEDLIQYHCQRVKKFEKRLEKFSFSEIISMPDMESIRTGQVRAGYLNAPLDIGLRYNTEEFCAHLRNIVRLLQTFENYDVYLAKATNMKDQLVYAKKNSGVLVAKISPPPILFTIHEASLTDAFTSYLNAIIQKSSKEKGKEHRKMTASALTKIIEELETL